MSEYGPQETRLDALDHSLRETLVMLRKRRGMGVNEIAAMVGVEYKTIWRIEKGTRRLHMGLFLRVCEALGEPSSKVLKFAVNNCPKQEKPIESPLSLEGNLS